MKEKKLYKELDQISGVKGWLLLVCISMISFSCLGIFELFTKIDLFNLNVLGIIFIFLAYAPLFYVLIAAILLWFIRDNALLHAKISISIHLISSILITVLTMSISSSEIISTALLVNILVIARSIIYLMYLRRSLRVKNTYKIDSVNNV